MDAVSAQYWSSYRLAYRNQTVRRLWVSSVLLSFGFLMILMLNFYWTIMLVYVVSNCWTLHLSWWSFTIFKSSLSTMVFVFTSISFIPVAKKMCCSCLMLNPNSFHLVCSSWTFLNTFDYGAISILQTLWTFSSRIRISLKSSEVRFYWCF